MTTELPRALAPWRELLELFPRELALGLGPWVRRLALAVGPLRKRQQEGGGEPDGFEGLARRGPYERLLSTEWLLAEELPEEFLRRAAAGEQGFLRLARQEPARARVSLALFDAGPEQMGAPRILHIAALVVLAQRAQAAGAEFRWAVLQQPGENASAVVTAGSVRGMLAARSAFAASSQDVESWLARAGGARRPEDVWLVGGARLAEIAARRGLASVDADDVLEPGVRRVRVGVRRVDGARAEMVLDLPPEPDAVRLLRDPFYVVAPAPARAPATAAPASNLVFAASGRKLLARRAGGDVVSYPVPNSPADPHAKSRIYPVGQWGCAVGVYWCQRYLTPLVIANPALPRKLAARGVQPVLLEPGSLPFAFDPWPAAPLEAILSIQDPGGTTERFPGDLLYREPAGGLWRVETRSKVAWTRMAASVSAMAAHGPAVNYVVNAAGRALVSRDFVRNQVLTEALDGDGTFEAFYGWGSYRAGFGLVAVHQFAAAWTVFANGRAHAIEPRPGQRVVGAGVLSSGAGVPAGGALGLLVLEDGGRVLSLQEANNTRRLVTSSKPIVHVTASWAGPQLAYCTSAGDVGFYSLRTGGALRLIQHQGAGTGAGPSTSGAT